MVKHNKKYTKIKVYKKRSQKKKNYRGGTGAIPVTQAKQIAKEAAIDALGMIVSAAEGKNPSSGPSGNYGSSVSASSSSNEPVSNSKKIEELTQKLKTKAKELINKNLKPGSSGFTRGMGEFINTGASGTLSGLPADKEKILARMGARVLKGLGYPKTAEDLEALFADPENTKEKLDEKLATDASLETAVNESNKPLEEITDPELLAAEKQAVEGAKGEEEGAKGEEEGEKGEEPTAEKGEGEGVKGEEEGEKGEGEEPESESTLEAKLKTEEEEANGEEAKEEASVVPAAVEGNEEEPAVEAAPSPEPVEAAPAAESGGGKTKKKRKTIRKIKSKKYRRLSKKTRNKRKLSNHNYNTNV